MKTPKNPALYVSPELHRRVVLLATFNDVKINEYVDSKFSTVLEKEEAVMRQQMMAGTQPRRPRASSKTS